MKMKKVKQKDTNKFPIIEERFIGGKASYFHKIVRYDAKNDIVHSHVDFYMK